MEQAVGNTGADRKLPKKARNWCFTFNNPQNDSIGPEQLEQFLSLLEPKAYVFQLEVGESGTPHYQGCVAVKNPIVMPKWLHEGIHWEMTRSWAKSTIYCQKDEGRLGGPWGMNVTLRKPLKVITELRPWQQELKEILDEEPDDRTIHWYWEEEGNMGKTAMAKYICSKYDALFLSGKASDSKHIVAKYVNSGKTLHAAVFGFPRSMEEYVSYEGLESIKDGIFCSGKYDGSMVMYNPPHVFVFANFAPDMSKLSMDRWRVKKIGSLNDW